MIKKKNLLIGLIIAIISGGILITVPFLLPDTEEVVIQASEIEVDDTGTVYYIVDGDTYDQDGLPDTDRVRLADVDSPESYETGYQAAKDYLYALIYGEFIYLDIDDVYGTGPYGRWICIAYIRHNSTHVLNVNQALVDAGHAIIDDYSNEFNPYSWKLYYYHKN